MHEPSFVTCSGAIAFQRVFDAVHLPLKLLFHPLAQQRVFEEKHVTHEIEAVAFVDDLHSDVLMQWLFHNILRILLDEVYRFPYLFLIGTNDDHIIAVYLHPHVKEHHHQSA